MEGKMEDNNNKAHTMSIYVNIVQHHKRGIIGTGELS